MTSYGSQLKQNNSTDSFPIRFWSLRGYSVLKTNARAIFLREEHPIKEMGARGRSLDREQVAIMQTRQEPKRVRSLNNVQGERQTASQLDNSPLSSQTLSKLCCERSRTIFSSCLAKLPNWHIGLPNGVFQIQVAVNEADVCSILAYAFSTHQLYSQMAVGWERLNGNPNCPLAALDEPSNRNTPGPDREPNLCVRTQFCMPSNMANVNPTSDEHQSEKNEIAKELPRAIKGALRRRSTLSDKRSSVNSLREVVAMNREIEKILVCGANFHPIVSFSDVETAVSGGSEIEVTFYYALQFHAIRHHLCVNEASFLRSLLRSEEFQGSGGKGGLSFAITSDKRYIVKQINRHESSLLLSRGNYIFGYFAQVLYHSVPSTLAMIYGMYQINFKRGAERWKRKFVVLQNIRNLVEDPRLSLSPLKFEQLDSSELVVSFDLKGVDRNRAVPRRVESRQNIAECSRKTANSATDSEPEVSEISPKSPEISLEAPVLWDQNFREYTNGLPITLQRDESHVLEVAIQNDTLLLSHLGVVDYSLLVFLNESTKVVSAGIIDFFRPYTWDKQVETVSKSLAYIASGVRPTVVSPLDYASRFRKAMGTFFRGVQPPVPFIVMPIKRKNRCGDILFLQTCSCSSTL
eukprot:GHVN01019552.1.p1 GENE.GHVN01019552.1~~GHVN01019552.1.p1  ORF type:complete len:634 (-),score=31.04 GHVN01019552.1:158-2059(-)